MYNPWLPSKTTISDEAFLHRYFHYYLHSMYHNDPIKNMICDGFEEQLDPMHLCQGIYDLADRLGYKLVDNMWVEK